MNEISLQRPVTLARKESILTLLRQNGTLTISELARTFDCSPATIRRDIHDLLQEVPAIRRYHGAIGLDGSEGEQWFHEKEEKFTPEKDAIADCLAQWLPDGSTIGLNGGTTTARIALKLAQQKKRLTIVTNAVNIAYQLAGSDIEVVVIGGTLRPRNYETIGPTTRDNLSRLHLDFAILGTNGLDIGNGATSTAEDESAVGQCFAEVADNVVIAADHSKFGRNALYRMLNWPDIDFVVSDQETPISSGSWSLLLRHPNNTSQNATLWSVSHFGVEGEQV